LKRVTPQAEYAEFEVEVRRPGNAFLALNPAPTSEQFRKKNHWSRAAKDLHAAYDGICAYTSTYMPDVGSIDHYRPKTTNPELAYEWSNYRLAAPRVNNSKGNSLDVLDPFEIQDGWFTLDIPSCLIKPGAALDPALRTRVNATVNILRLNSDDMLVQERCNILLLLAKGKITLDFVAERYPFIAFEVDRQKKFDQLKALFKLDEQA
jgi:hypothetical protein